MIRPRAAPRLRAMAGRMCPPAPPGALPSPTPLALGKGKGPGVLTPWGAMGHWADVSWPLSPPDPSPRRSSPLRSQSRSLAGARRFTDLAAAHRPPRPSARGGWAADDTALMTGPDLAPRPRVRPQAAHSSATLTWSRCPAWRGCVLLGVQGSWPLGTTGCPRNEHAQQRLLAGEPSPRVSLGRGERKSTHQTATHGNLSLRQMKNRFHLVSSTNTFSEKQLCVCPALAAFPCRAGQGRVAADRPAPRPTRGTSGWPRDRSPDRLPQGAQGTGSAWRSGSGSWAAAWHRSQTAGASPAPAGQGALSPSLLVAQQGCHSSGQCGHELRSTGSAGETGESAQATQNRPGEQGPAHGRAATGQ